MTANICAAWIGFFLGCIAGAIPGLFFHQADWLGGYSSWGRRLIRLAHISFFGLGFINMAFAFTAERLGLDAAAPVPGRLLIAGAITMPLVCYLSAWKEGFRHLFAVPALCVTGGVGIVLWKVCVS